jgi:hypothetical protein
LFGGRRAEPDDDYYEEDDELREMRRPVRAYARGRGQVEIHTGPRRRRHHGSPVRFEDYRKVNGDDYDDRSTRHRAHARARAEDDEEPEEEDVVASRAHRAAHAGAKEHHGKAQAAAEDEEEDEEAVARREAQETRRPRQRSHEEEVAIQRFVERALRQYEHPAR